MKRLQNGTFYGDAGAAAEQKELSVPVSTRRATVGERLEGGAITCQTVTGAKTQLLLSPKPQVDWFCGDYVVLPGGKKKSKHHHSH